MQSVSEKTNEQSELESFPIYHTSRITDFMGLFFVQPIDFLAFLIIKKPLLGVEAILGGYKCGK